MLLAIDVGNTHTVLGLYEGKVLKYHWRIETHKEKTADELGILILDLFRLSQDGNVSLSPSIQGIIISNVVPPMQHALMRMSERYFNQTPLFVVPGIKTKMKIKYYKMEEVGADRIVNAVGAYYKYKKPLIVVDFGTATTFDYVTAKGEYIGGLITPGIVISNEALSERASRLPRVEIIKPRRLIGRSTVESIQSGVFYGYVGLVDGIVNRMKKEVKNRPLVIGTGGLANLVASESKTIQKVDPLLTLEGLRLLYSFNTNSKC
ncbi:MAG: pantothenate kinase [Deltaproteobacteria bacterium RIFCSPLOWO2_12_FULL_50_11]|nr:MAG: pantothenate kinase [Deltaproteobacteria bacterium GWA2_50_8]OGQ26495.1 MAG: pantothenate kinase [Deltaproteobacteria bacterium RIFCSPHIGHO2_02_FULL_50_15]OGQ69082.1 MAG: pantothenate kinase [Deltaproteobacteria bacterium RIFCSPLOWO2_12_FULL_50_11]